MKEVFWKIDASSGYSFSDATDPNQMVLFDADHSPKLASDISRVFANKKVAVEQILKYVEDDTPYIKCHMDKALLSLESGQQIQVDLLKRDGNKRRKGSFPEGVVIHFN